MIIGILFILLFIGANAIAELANQGKIKWKSVNPYGFWGEYMDRRKYKNYVTGKYLPPKDNWYYRFFKIPHREKWFTSATFTVMFTDGYHLAQAISNLCLAVGLWFIFGLGWWWLLAIWLVIVGSYAMYYKLFSNE
jgi:hypothetical protein